MLLVVDAGNTNTVMAVHDGRNWVGRWRISTDAQRTSDEYAVWLLTLLTQAGIRREHINAAVIGTVVPAALYDMRRFCRATGAVALVKLQAPQPDELGFAKQVGWWEIQPQVLCNSC